MSERNGLLLLVTVVSRAHSALSLLLIVELLLSFSEETLLSHSVLLNSSCFLQSLQTALFLQLHLNQPCYQSVPETHPHSNSRTGPAELRALPQNLLLLLLSHFQCLWILPYFCISLRQAAKPHVLNTLSKYISKHTVNFKPFCHISQGSYSLGNSIQIFLSTENWQKQ